MPSHSPQSPTQDQPLRPPESTSFLSSPGDVLQQELIPKTLLCPPSQLPLCRHFLLREETKGSARIVLTSEAGPSRLLVFQSHSQVLLKEWRRKDTEGLQWAEINWGNTATSWIRISATEIQAYFFHPWLRITVFHHTLKIKGFENLRIWCRVKVLKLVHEVRHGRT